MKGERGRERERRRGGEGEGTTSRGEGRGERGEGRGERREERGERGDHAYISNARSYKEVRERQSGPIRAEESRGDTKNTK